jgi:hypothetical protein
MPTSESYSSTTTGYVVAKSMEDALGRTESARDTTHQAWSDLGYWEREEYSHLYDIYEVVVEKKVRKAS